MVVLADDMLYHYMKKESDSYVHMWKCMRTLKSFCSTVQCSTIQYRSRHSNILVGLKGGDGKSKYVDRHTRSLAQF